MLDLAIEELIELAIGILPTRFRIRLHRQLLEPIIVELRDLEIGAKIGTPIATVSLGASSLF
jgi:hypothetical protein